VWTLYLGAVPTALGFVLWAFALARTNVGRLGATTYLVPPLSVLLSWLWLGQTPASLAYLGGALCLAGVALTRMRRVRPRRNRRGDEEAVAAHSAAAID
jgi:drug/metabolite transporter (DMT)-like permease